LEKQLFREVALYGIATGLNRGIVLLFLPFLTQILTLGDLGLYSLIQAVSIILAFILSLNGAAGIMREGVNNNAVALNLLVRFTIITFILCLPLSILFYFVDVEWLKFAFYQGIGESLLLLLLTYYRSLEKVGFYFSLVIFKVFTLFFFIQFCFIHHYSDLIFLLKGQVYIYILISFIYLLYEIISNRVYLKTNIPLKDVLLFTIPLLLHSISQWTISSSDRVILKFIVDKESVGVYSIAYTIAMMLMLLNSGIALALPQHLIKNYKLWTEPTFLRRNIIIYSIAAIIVFSIGLIVTILDEKYFHTLGYYKLDLFLAYTIICIGIYLLGLYFIYSNFLFYHKQSKTLSIQTFKVAQLNITLTLLLSYQIGVAGAALGTAISYLYYLFLVNKAAIALEPSLKKNNRNLITSVVITISTFSAIISLLIHFKFNLFIEK